MIGYCQVRLPQTSAKNLYQAQSFENCDGTRSDQDEG
jgi:hypothetical protein